jgi:acylphosphatase
MLEPYPPKGQFSPMRTAQRLIIHGHVQGVGYRYWAETEAMRLGLDGWVRNRLDSTVELVAAGPPAAVAEFVEACHTGPRAARVTSVQRVDAEDEGFVGFRARPTV